ncbi:MAG: triose-phosphate isomerase [Candidatus Sungbacteria bacterium]|nr:triose-phosphate isomerase [Candidatus Sungbacteria bacterium]
MTKPLIVFNWKMNPQTEAEAVELFSHVWTRVKTAKYAAVAVAPPFPFLSSIEKRWGIRDLEVRGEAPVHLAAQDAFWEREGAYTGEISPAMETGLGVTYVILGHSERRRFLGETDAMVNAKLRAALEYGLRPILCIGEEMREGNSVPELVGTQLKNAVHDIPPLLLEASLIVAYEPVWAISSGGGGLSADTPSDMHKTAIYIRKVLAELYGEGCAERVRVLYGGSVTAENASSFFTETERTVNGVLVGRASLNIEEAGKIIGAVELAAALALGVS